VCHHVEREANRFQLIHVRSAAAFLADAAAFNKELPREHQLSSSAPGPGECRAVYAIIARG
jgi:hypothetical protein